LGERSATIELTMEDSGESILLDAESITNWRTGAAAALGAKYLAPTNSPIVAILGTGRIAESTAVAVDRVLTPDVIRVTSRSAEKRDAFRARVAPRVQARLETVLTVEDAVSEADTVITAVPTPKPILSNAMLKSGAHLSVVAGDPRTVQLEEDILRERPLVVDHPDQARASGDFVRYVDRVSKFRTLNVDGRQATIGDAATGRLESHRGAGCVTYFTGMAIQDLHAAFVVLSKAGLVRELHV
jgi:ornithine cyclodeaminase/alanine dehydrogenase-like protein (mu-crystallin family)